MQKGTNGIGVDRSVPVLIAPALVVFPVRDASFFSASDRPGRSRHPDPELYPTRSGERPITRPVRARPGVGAIFASRAGVHHDVRRASSVGSARSSSVSDSRSTSFFFQRGFASGGIHAATIGLRSGARVRGRLFALRSVLRSDSMVGVGCGYSNVLPAHRSASSLGRVVTNRCGRDSLHRDVPSPGRVHPRRLSPTFFSAPLEDRFAQARDVLTLPDG